MNLRPGNDMAKRAKITKLVVLATLIATIGTLGAAVTAIYPATANPIEAGTGLVIACLAMLGAIRHKPE